MVRYIVGGVVMSNVSSNIRDIFDFVIDLIKSIFDFIASLFEGCSKP